MSFIIEVVKQRKTVFKNALVKFSAVTVLVFIGFFSISGTKLPNYPMPCYPFIALLIGYWIKMVIDENKKTKVYPFLIIMLLNLCFLVGAFIGIGVEPSVSGLQLWALILLVPVIS